MICRRIGQGLYCARGGACYTLHAVNLSLDRARLVLPLLLVAVLAVGVWAYRGVGDSLREIRATGLKTLLDTQVEALEQWITEGRHEAEQLSDDDALRATIARLARGDSGGEALVARILQAAGNIGITSVHIVDLHGRILASSDSGRVGQEVTADFFAHLAPALEGRSVFVRPYRGGSGAGPSLLGRAWVAAPVRATGGKPVAIIALGAPAGERFAALFRVARPGLTGESLAFDADGWLLSESRHADDLSQQGLAHRMVLPETDDVLTQLAGAAIAARTGGARQGQLLTPYPNYLGREVIGAWRWLADHNIGVAVEMGASEAYAPLVYLQIGFGVVLLLTGVVWLSGFLPPHVLASLLRREGRAKQLGPYRLLRQIGEGALANVYLAQHRMLKRPAAVKVLKPQTTSDEWTARFQREVQFASQLSHPNTITIYDYGTSANGQFWYAMEYLEGLSLADLVERYGPQPPARTAWILRQACASLWEAHAGGLVHRDIKPQNIMLCDIRGERDVVKVLDFGLVKQTSGDQTRDLTSTLRILGTPLYMSPERIRHPGDADARADIYALGAVGFHLLTGKRLFETETEHDLIYQVLHTVPPLVSACAPFTVPVELDALIGRCLEKDPDRRPQSMAEVASALDAVLVYQPWTRSQIEDWWRRHWVAEDSPERRFSIR